MYNLLDADWLRLVYDFLSSEDFPIFDKSANDAVAEPRFAGLAWKEKRNNI